MIKAYAAMSKGGKLEAFEYDPGELGMDEVELEVESCGICHSDLSMLDNEWGMTAYPFVPGHEVIGTISQLGSNVKHLQLGQRVGLGWHSSYCQTCSSCHSGDHNLCDGAEATIGGRHGGFADKVRAQSTAVVPLPDGVDPHTAGPLFCGGITVFNPLVQFDVSPNAKVGVVGIGGLGHMALAFLKAWGCEVTAFTSSRGKKEELLALGAHRVVNSRSEAELDAVQGSYDLILSTVNVKLDWNRYVSLLAPKGRLHFVGATLEPLDIAAFPLISGQRSISGSPVGSPAVISKMLEFAARHDIAPITEFYGFDEVNEALDRLRQGQAHYRVVLTRNGFENA